ncbi:hypothetical protein [Flagellimonas aequoris]|uniref:SIMPL domain-containing protein n=1 Tax=Flagellimonas aequoris TaxID=2306997 RepID=A0A418N6E0_9FLAO|nr:hypothetical protein [Allomuricauda aequoris]RIV69846.1 hypothetical protein D2U88_11895 [Allomuricauda aequoris]TXK01432.1 hypothetical protein FQ019_11785 [Allomuricauda aequoris]
MKTILTIIAVVFFGTVAMAQDTSKEVKVDTVTVGVELNIDLSTSVKQNREVARLYKFKNSRVKKELSFTTKKNKAKLA